MGLRKQRSCRWAVRPDSTMDLIRKWLQQDGFHIKTCKDCCVLPINAKLWTSKFQTFVFKVKFCCSGCVFVLAKYFLEPASIVLSVPRLNEDWHSLDALWSAGDETLHTGMRRAAEWWMDGHHEWLTGSGVVLIELHGAFSSADSHNIWWQLLSWAWRSWKITAVEKGVVLQWAAVSHGVRLTVTRMRMEAALCQSSSFKRTHFLTDSGCFVAQRTLI